jgi:dihydrofolate reductase
MGKVILDMSMSLDGFISALDETDGRLHNWFFGPSDGEKGSNTAVIDESIRTTGAILMGRNTYNLGDQFDGFADTPYRVPHVVLTHDIPEKAAKGETRFVFITDGIESALAQAQAAAGDKNVVVGGGANTAQQYIKAGLVDEIQIHLVPVLFGAGIRSFDQLGTEPTELEITRAIESPDATHLTYRVVK